MNEDRRGDRRWIVGQDRKAIRLYSVSDLVRDEVEVLQTFMLGYVLGGLFNVLVYPIEPFCGALITTGLLALF